MSARTITPPPSSGPAVVIYYYYYQVFFINVFKPENSDTENSSLKNSNIFQKSPGFLGDGRQALIQGDQLNMNMLFWHLGKGDLSSVHVYSGVHWISHFIKGARKTRTCLTGHPVQYRRAGLPLLFHFFKEIQFSNFSVNEFIQ